MAPLIALGRTAGTLFFGTLFIAVFAAWLIHGTLTNHLLSAEFYIDAARDADAYERLYDERLIEEQLQDRVLDVTGGVAVTTGDLAPLIREIVPPRFLQDQTEHALTALVAYLNQDRGTLALTFDLAEPVGQIRPVIVRYAQDRVSRTPARPAASAEEFLAFLEQSYLDLQDGALPSELLTYQMTPAEADEAVARIPGAIQLTGDERDAIREALVSGRTRDALLAAVDPALGPLYERSVAALKQDLGEELKFDPVRRAAAEEGKPVSEYLSGLDDLRSTIGRLRSPTTTMWAVALLVVAALVTATHAPSLRSGLLWAGMVATVSAGGVLLLSVLVRAASTRALDVLFDEAAGGQPILRTLYADVAGSMIEAAASDWVVRAAIVLAVGIGVVASSRLVPHETS